MTPRLEWDEPGGRHQVYVIASPEVVIGRKSDADVVLSSARVSRRHAQLIAGPDGHELVDLSSTYGTFVNDERIDRCLLRHGDSIAFGKDGTRFSYLIDSEDHTAARATELDTSRIVQDSFQNLGRILPSAASDLEKILCVLDFQYQWNQVFTPESAFEQILNSALSISGAERAFIMVEKSGKFGYAAGMDGTGRRLSQGDFRASESIVREVVAQREAIFMVEGIPQNFAAQASIVAMNLRAIACMPLFGIPTEGDTAEILGILYLDSTKTMHSLSGLDERILNKLGVEAGNVLERIEMIKSIDRRKNLERDLALAEETQRSLLPHRLPVLANLRLHAFSRPTRYVGGDFYHFQLKPSRELIGVLADVSGKGVAASLLSSMLLGCLQLLLHGGDAPAVALTKLNKFLLEKASGRFATMFLFSILPDGSGEYISAGHNPVYVYRAAEQDIEQVESNCMVVGAFDFATFHALPMRLLPGDILMVYSDGLTDAENAAGEMFGDERLKAIIRKEAPGGAEQLQKAALSAIEEFTRGRTQTDDMTIIIAQQV